MTTQHTKQSTATAEQTGPTPVPVLTPLIYELQNKTKHCINTSFIKQKRVLQTGSTCGATSEQQQVCGNSQVCCAASALSGAGA
jgi:hypothetical protein